MAGILLFLSIILIPSLSFAAISLNVTPADGSSSLKLEQAYLGLDNKKDVRIRVTATDGKRYQVFARVLDPIVNEKGESLDVRSVSLATMASSNTSGTLYLQNENPLSMGEQLIYSSGQNGESDSFTITYALSPQNISSGGNYSGRLVFTARSSDGADSQAMLVINIQSLSHWKASVVGGKTSDRIMVNDRDVTERTADFVKITFFGNGGQDVRIYQEASVIPQNAEGADLGPDGLVFYAAGQGDGIKAQNVSVLSPNRTLVYQGHEPQAEMLLYYQLNPAVLSRQVPGMYAGRLKFTVESEQGTQDFNIDVQCQIQPVFTLDVSVPGSGISFDNVIANNPAQEREVTITVHTNLHKAYQVSQNFQSLMTNEKGHQISKEYFTVKVELPQGGSGRTKYQDFLPVETGEYPIFASNSKGDPVVFKVTYKLQGYQGMSAGNFNAPIQYSLNQN